MGTATNQTMLAALRDAPGAGVLQDIVGESVRERFCASVGRQSWITNNDPSMADAGGQREKYSNELSQF